MSTPMRAGGRLFSAILVGMVPIAIVVAVAAENQLVGMGRGEWLVSIALWLSASLFAWLVCWTMVVGPLRATARRIMRESISAPEPGSADPASPRTAFTGDRLVQDSFARLLESAREQNRRLDEALAHQTALTREVHHRVKNNLQIVVSLLSLHSRAETSDEAVRAYAVIKRRVDALSAVHRNHFAFAESHSGIALSSLLGDLAAAQGDSTPEGLPIPMSDPPVTDVQVDQDVALPLAFLLTELLEVARCDDPAAPIAIDVTRLEPEETPLARMTVQSPGFQLPMARDAVSNGPASRVIRGLSRQLRRAVEPLPGGDGYSLDFPVMGPAPQPGAARPA